MQVMLTPQMQAYLDGKVKSGGYASAEDVVRAGLSALEQQDTLVRLDADALEAAFPGARARIENGLDQARAGRLSDGDAFFEELEREG